MAAARGRRILRVNLDETAVRLYPGSSKGAVFVSKKRIREGRGQAVPSWKRRCVMTHIALICDRTDVQPRLPQFILGNERTFLAKQLRGLRSCCPSNVRLVRQKSAWNNAALMARVVRELAHAIASLRTSLGEFQIVLILDAVRIHYAPQVLRACAAAGVWLVVVPAGMTSLLQPLDTHAFALYKAQLLRAYQATRTESADPAGDVSMGPFLACVYVAIRKVLQGNRWAHAFDRDGYGSLQAELSVRTVRRLEWQVPTTAPLSRPTDELIKLCLPKRANASPARFLGPLDAIAGRAAPPTRVLPAGVALGRVAGVAAVAVPRTRLQSKRAAVVTAVAAAPCAAAAPSDAPVVFGRTRSDTRRLKALGMAAPP